MEGGLSACLAKTKKAPNYFKLLITLFDIIWILHLFYFEMLIPRTIKHNVIIEASL